MTAPTSKNALKTKPRFIVIQASPFKKIEDSLAFKSYGRGAPIRRPFMGMTDFADSPAVLTVITKDGKKLDILDMNTIDGKRKTKHYSNFLVEGINRQSQEKFQLIETWGEEWLLLYGKRPEVWAINGILVSSVNFPWESEFWRNYYRLFRGTRLAEEGARILFEIRNQYFTGYMLNATAHQESTAPQRIAFQFQFFITHSGFLDIAEAEDVLGLAPDTNKKISISTGKTFIRSGEFLNPPNVSEPPEEDSKDPSSWRGPFCDAISKEISKTSVMTYKSPVNRRNLSSKDNWTKDPVKAAVIMGAKTIRRLEHFGKLINDTFKAGSQLQAKGNKIIQTGYRASIEAVGQAQKSLEDLGKEIFSTPQKIDDFLKGGEKFFQQFGEQVKKHYEDGEAYLTNRAAKTAQDLKATVESILSIPRPGVTVFSPSQDS